MIEIGLRPFAANGGDIAMGDVILAVDDRETASVSALLSALDDHRVGDHVILRVLRDGQAHEIEVVLGAS